jgi:hypothetical protein
MCETYRLIFALRIVRRRGRGKIVGSSRLRRGHAHALVLTHAGFSHVRRRAVAQPLVRVREVHKSDLPAGRRSSVPVGWRAESHPPGAAKESAEETQKDENDSSWTIRSAEAPVKE